MSQLQANLLLAILVVLTTGCCLRKSIRPASCPPFVSQQSPVQVTEKSPQAGVEANFDSLPEYETIQRRLLDQILQGGPVKIDLLETACLAARNSDTAELIEAERHAIACRPPSCVGAAVATLLHGEALEQRNQAAGAAAEAFLSLVQIQLQRELLETSKTRLADLQTTIQAAQEAGFATAEGQNELAAGEIRLKKLASALNQLEQQTTVQLNLLINVDPDNPIAFEPVHALSPGAVDIDVRREIDIALANRPGIQAIESILAKGTAPETIQQLLGQFDPRLGIQLAPGGVKKLLLRRQIKNKLEQERLPDPAFATRRQQANQILAARKQAAQTESGAAMLQLQSSLEQLTIINEDIARLADRQIHLEAQQDLNAAGAYVAINQNWVQQQQAKSERVEAAIQHEIAKIKLLQAQGLLVTQCGYTLDSQCSVETCENFPSGGGGPADVAWSQSE